MTGASMMTKLLNVRVEEDTKLGLFFATSPELKGLLVAKPTVEELEAAVPRAIEELYAVCGADVIVSRLEDREDGLQPWVAIPAGLAKRLLESRAA